MKPYPIVKFIAIVLCACFLLVSVASGGAIIYLHSIGLYTQELEDIQFQNAEASLYTHANRIALRYAARELGDCSEELLQQYYPKDSASTLDKGLWFYTLADEYGTVLYSTYSGQTGVTARRYEDVSPIYPTVIRYYTTSTAEPTAPPETTLAETTGPTVPETTGPLETQPQEPDESMFLYTSGFGFYDADARLQHNYRLGFMKGPNYTVTLYLLPEAYPTNDTVGWQLLSFLVAWRYSLFVILGIGLLLFAACLTALCYWAGRTPGSGSIRPGGLNLLPLDLYAAVVAGGIWCASLLVNYLFAWILDSNQGPAPLVPALFVSLAACVLVAAFLFAVAAQSKTGDLSWLRRCLLFRLAMLVKNGILGLLQLLPLIWRWLLLAALVCLALVLAALGKNPWLLAGVILVALALTGYMAQCYARLFQGAREIGQGKLDTQVSSAHMAGSFQSFAHCLNSVADATSQAVDQQMRSERMKAELITNVSHDIKTPLTSIINYVDLLQKAQNQDQARGCLEVLQRQSQRMKKLLDDLMEMSKASTGNIPVEITTLSAAEAINQALGEFSDKLDAARLAPVFDSSSQDIQMACDGRLTWRVLSNLLSNAVKYSLPGTRLYIDLWEEADFVGISLKNVSREQLNVSSQELMERFVRGDTSRNTEGSGLGLNIAQSLMELQQGTLELVIDGDLFKAILRFPKG